MKDIEPEKLGTKYKVRSYEDFMSLLDRLIKLHSVEQALAEFLIKENLVKTMENKRIFDDGEKILYFMNTQYVDFLRLISLNSSLKNSEYDSTRLAVSRIVPQLCSLGSYILSLKLLESITSKMVLLRALREHVDAYILITTDASTAEEFLETTRPVCSNEFWHRRISKRRVRKSLLAMFERSFNSREIPLETRSERFDEVLGMFVHPSMGAGELEIVHMIANFQESLGITEPSLFQQTRQVRHGYLTYMLTTMFSFILFGHKSEKVSGFRLSSLFADDQQDDIDKLIQVLLELYVWVIRDLGSIHSGSA